MLCRRREDGGISHEGCTLSGRVRWAGRWWQLPSARLQLRPASWLPSLQFRPLVSCSIHTCVPDDAVRSRQQQTRSGGLRCMHRATEGHNRCGNSPDAATCSTSKHPELQGAAWRQMANKHDRWQPVWAGCNANAEATQKEQRWRRRWQGGWSEAIAAPASTCLWCLRPHPQREWQQRATRSGTAWDGRAWLAGCGSPTFRYTGPCIPATGPLLLRSRGARCDEVSMLGGVTGARTLPATLHGTGISSCATKPAQGSPPDGARCLLSYRQAYKLTGSSGLLPCGI